MNLVLNLAGWAMTSAAVVCIFQGDVVAALMFGLVALADAAGLESGRAA